MKKTLTLALFATAALAAAAPVKATTLDMGMLTNYGLVDLGSGTTLGMNSGPFNGSVLVGNGVTTQFSGGNNGGISGALYTDGTGSISGSLQNGIAGGTQTVANTFTYSAPGSALSVAQTLSNTAASLTATQTYGAISGATTFAGNGGLNVIDVNSIQNAPITITGSANDIFVINISGNYQTNVGMTLNGVSASQILFNFTGTSGNVLQTSGSNCSMNGYNNEACLYGTFLAADGGGFQFSHLGLTGELINTGGNVQFVSGTTETAQGFAGYNSGGSPVPEPSTLALFGLGLAGLAFVAKRRMGPQSGL